MRKQAMLQSVSVGGFKAIVNAGPVPLTPFTVFIGNNGSGKSSIIEALQTYRAFVLDGIDAAMEPWLGLEHVRNKARPRSRKPDPLTGRLPEKPVTVRMKGIASGKQFDMSVAWNSSASERLLYVQDERFRYGKLSVRRDRNDELWDGGELLGHTGPPSSALATSPDLRDLRSFVERWQFISLWPGSMGRPRSRTRSKSRSHLSEDGSNIAEYLGDIRKESLQAFDAIIEAMRYVLPYAQDLQTVGISNEVEESAYLQMAEADFKVAGWMLSSGTLRMLGMLAVLHDPTPPPLVVIEEIENGLDPRTINLLIEEIKAANDEGIQVIATTHSPYLLDSVPLESVVLVERVDGEPKFTRPADSEEVQRWAKEFTTGRLYTMSRLSGGRA